MIPDDTQNDITIIGQQLERIADDLHYWLPKLVKRLTEIESHLDPTNDENP